MTTFLELILYGIYMFIIVMLLLGHDPPQRSNTGLAGLAYGAALIASFSSGCNLLGQHFTDFSAFCTWLCQFTTEVYTRHGQAESRQWNGMVVLYFLSPVFLFCIDKIFRKQLIQRFTKLWIKSRLE